MMTMEEYDIKDILVELGAMIDEKDKDVLKAAIDDSVLPIVSDHMWRVHTGRAIRLYKMMRQQGSTFGEMKQAARYLYAAINARKDNYDLDVVALGEDIDELRMKYLSASMPYGAMLSEIISDFAETYPVVYDEANSIGVLEKLYSIASALDAECYSQEKHSL